MAVAIGACVAGCVTSIYAWFSVLRVMERQTVIMRNIVAIPIIHGIISQCQFSHKLLGKVDNFV